MVEKNVDIETGAKKFLKSSDALLGRAADYLDTCEDFTDIPMLATLREVCDIVKITATSVKALREDGEEKKKESESPIDKQKRRANGNQVAV